MTEAKTLITSPAQAIADLDALMALRLSALMLGQPGVGKSDIARAAARRHLKTDTLVETGEGRNFIDFRATLVDPVDLHGLPTVDHAKMVARWVPMGLLPNADDQSEGVLFIDEITNCDRALQGALYGLALHPHRIGDYTLPKGWKIIAAGNRVEDRAAAGRMSSALANRFVQMTLEPTVDDFIEYAMGNNIAAELIAFFRFRPALLNDFDPARQINATPRSWEMVSKIVSQKLPQDVEGRLICGAVGNGPGGEFSAFLKVWRDLPDPDTVLMNPTGAAVPDSSAARWAIAGAVAQRVRETTMDAFVTYIDRLPAEFSIKAMLDAKMRDPALTMTRAHQEWALRNQDVYL